MQGPSSVHALGELIEPAGYTLAESETLSGVSPRLAPVPEALAEPLRNHLRELYPAGLYAHQAEAMSAFLGGDDLCLATSTASGKSLIFMGAAVHRLLSHELCKVLALYPVRALIQDQLKKWQEILKPFGFKVGFIDGGVPSEYRGNVLQNSDVILMTPDVMHAWMMSSLRTAAVTEFLASLHILVLDEAHVYDGAFGTNVAYLLRRISAAARPHRLISSTATLGDPDAFAEKLTGRRLRVFGQDEDGSGRQEMTIHLLHPGGKSAFDGMVSLIRGLGAESTSPFLAFADSRKAVELLVAAIRRERPEAAGAEEKVHGAGADLTATVLPYRAGYETDDRHEIQRALSQGLLSGVVSTSALELGLDIGDISTVVLLDLPTTAKTLWQRIGRAGRRSPGRCLILDQKQKLASVGKSLSDYLSGTPEPNWLYLDNRYIQYAHVLCAARECADNGIEEIPDAFDSLPEAFPEMVANELNPTGSIRADLYPMKQRAEADPHHEFPLRSCSEQNFRVDGPNQSPLGTLAFSQAIREAYPGAIYYYMGRPYRVLEFRPRDGRIRVRKEKYWTTQPTLQVMTFPNFRGGVFNLRASGSGFLAETELQVSERVIGFRERRGPNEENMPYGPDSPHSTRPINRFFATTGVCWFLPNRACCDEQIALAIREAFALEFGLQEGDLGVGLFHAQASPLGSECCQGTCVYDVTHGSLRLTEKLAYEFGRVVETAVSLAAHREDAPAQAILRKLQSAVQEMNTKAVTPGEQARSEENDWVEVVASGSSAILHGTDGQQEVKVVGVRYTPQGVMYDLASRGPGMARWSVAMEYVQPIFGETRLAMFNVMTGEVEERG